jgi:acyl-CoA hydrolase
MGKHHMQDSIFRPTYTVTAADLNHFGLIHGGRLLTLCDEAGYVSAHRHQQRATTNSGIIGRIST